MLERPFTRARGDIERLRAEIARAIADAVDVRLTPDEAARFRRAHQTTPAAEEAYIRGRIQLTAYGPEPARQAAGQSRSRNPNPHDPSLFQRDALSVPDPLGG